MFLTQSIANKRKPMDVFYHVAPNYLSHASEPADFYRKYEDDSITPAKGKRSQRNLFDDSDINDRYWLDIAKKILRMNNT